jgi:archaellum component FlaC
MDEKMLLEAIGQMMDAKLENALQPINERLDAISERTERLEVLLENDIPKQIKTLAEGHKGILDRLPEANEIDSLRSRIRTLEKVVTDHTDEINELKKAN